MTSALHHLFGKFNQSTVNPLIKGFAIETVKAITERNVDLIKKNGEMLAVSSDPKTFEMRRDLLPEIK